MEAGASDDGQPGEQGFAVEMMVTGVNPATLRDGSTFGVKAWVGAERTRIDLEMPEADDAFMILDNATGEGWVINKEQDGALPVTIDAYRELIVDPADPCANLGVVCHPIGWRDIAGVRGRGWRYAGAKGQGPGGSHLGEMWIDPASGFILGYDGLTRDREVRRMRAVEVKREPLPDALFELPSALGSR